MWPDLSAAKGLPNNSFAVGMSFNAPGRRLSTTKIEIPARLASAHSGWQLEGRPIRVERYTASGWVLVAQKKLQQNAVWGEAYATFRILRKGLRLRAFVPLSSARPCFVAGASSITDS